MSLIPTRIAQWGVQNAQAPDRTGKRAVPASPAAVNNLFSCLRWPQTECRRDLACSLIKQCYAKPRPPMQNYYGLIVTWLSTVVVPGADHAALSASSFSAHERTLP
jgi:hypothetical protein